jgi:hypothetical protein
MRTGSSFDVLGPRWDTKRGIDGVWSVRVASPRRSILDVCEHQAAIVEFAICKAARRAALMILLLDVRDGSNADVKRCSPLVRFARDNGPKSDVVARARSVGARVNANGNVMSLLH